MRSRLFIITSFLEALVIAVLILAAGTGVYYGYRKITVEQKWHRDDVTRLNGQATQLAGQLATNQVDATNKLNDRATQIADANLKIYTSATQAVSQDAAIHGLQNQLADCQAQAKTDSTNIDACNQKVANQQTQIDKLTSQLDCTDFPVLTNPDYTSNETIDIALKVWVADADGSVKHSSVDLLFKDELSSIHYINGEQYFWVFMVTFASDTHHPNEVLWLGPNCFLDRPK